MSTADLFHSFDWQIDAKLFADESELETVLHSMRDEGVQFNVASKGWSIGDSAHLPDRFKSRF